MTESVSESENPAIASPSSEVPTRGRTMIGGRISSTSACCTATLPCRTRWARASTTPRSSRRSIWTRSARRPDRADDLLAGLVAGGLRPLRSAVHPHELARRRDLPDRRRAWRRRHRRPALCAAEQLARQREPGQGAPAAVADQAEVRPQDLLGRPARLHGQRGDGDDGLSDVRLRLRQSRTSGSPKRSSGVRRTPGWATSATAASASSPNRSARCRWA